MTAVNTNLTLTIGAQYAGALTIEQLTSVINRTYVVTHTPGSGQGQVALQFAQTRTLAAGATDSLDLNGPSLVDAFGNPLAFTKIKAIIIAASAANINTLTIGSGANALATIFGGAAQTLTLQPGEVLAKITPSAAGYAVTAATADLLQIVNPAGNPSTYDITVFGA